MAQGAGLFGGCLPRHGKLLVNEPALEKLQALRNGLRKPLIVRSAYRSPEHNRAVGGAKRSKHMERAAFDIAMTNHHPHAFEAAAREVGFLGFGFYRRSGFIHVDLGPARQWGERFPSRPTAFAGETPPAREVLADSRTMKGGGAAGVATLGAAGVAGWGRWRTRGARAAHLLPVRQEYMDWPRAPSEPVGFSSSRTNFSSRWTSRWR